MAVVLLANEFGAGLGHATRLMLIAKALAARGHRPVFALPDLVAAGPVVHRERFPAFQGPVWVGRRYPRKSTRTFADILADKGFADPEILWPVVEGWQRLLDVIRPAIIVGDHCPSLCLAAFDQVPLVLVGNGFTVPPTEFPTFPPLLADVPPGLPEERILASIAKVQRLRRRPAPETLPGLLAGAGNFAAAFPETDPYRAVRGAPADGPLKPPPAPAPVPPSRRFYAYLSTSYPGTGKMLASLAASRLEGDMYIQGATTGQIARLRKAGLSVHDRPPSLDEVVPRATVVLHHGGLGVATAAIAVGRPQLLVPRYLEQRLTAIALEEEGVARRLRHRREHDTVADAVGRMMEDAGLAERALALAHAVHARGPYDTLSKIVELCDELVS